MRPTDLTECPEYSDALRAELATPSQALGLWRTLQKRNSKIHRDVLILGFVGPTIGYFVALQVAALPVWGASGLSYATWTIVGFAPCYLTAVVRLESAKRQWGFIEVLLHGYVLLLLPFIEVAHFFVTILVTALVAAPLFVVLNILNMSLNWLFYGYRGPWLWPTDVPDRTLGILLIPLAVVVFIFLATDVPVSRRGLRMVPAALRTRVKKILIFLVLLVTTLAIRHAEAGLEQVPASIGVVSSALAGIVLGVTFGRIQDNGLVEAILHVAQTRCHLLLGCRSKAEYLALTMKYAVEGPMSPIESEAYEIVESSQGALLSVLRGRSGSYAEASIAAALDDASSAVLSMQLVADCVEYTRLTIAHVSRTGSTLGGDQPPGSA